LISHQIRSRRRHNSNLQVQPVTLLQIFFQVHMEATVARVRGKGMHGLLKISQLHNLSILVFRHNRYCIIHHRISVTVARTHHELLPGSASILALPSCTTCVFATSTAWKFLNSSSLLIVSAFSTRSTSPAEALPESGYDSLPQSNHRYIDVAPVRPLHLVLRLAQVQSDLPRIQSHTRPAHHPIASLLIVGIEKSRQRP